MASVSFAALDQDFFVGIYTNVEFASYDGTLYDYVTTAPHHWSIAGTGLTQTGGLLDGGTVTGASFDLDNDSTTEVVFTGVSAGGASLSIGVGTGEEQNDRFWAALLAGDDTIDLTMANYAAGFAFNGDGANIADGMSHSGGNDSFNDGGTALSGQSILAGDFYLVIDGTGVGGDDTFTVGAFQLLGDFSSVYIDGSATGGDDVIAPARLVDNPFGYFLALGDGEFIDGSLTGGHDLIDLGATSMAGFTNLAWMIGDAFFVGPTGTLIGGNDTIIGSQYGDSIAGDFEDDFGASAGGNDSLSGGGGDDTISGDNGFDALDGGDGDDLLDGGTKGDRLDGGAGFDFLHGRGGFDTIMGGDDSDTLAGGSGFDQLDGGAGGDFADGDAGADNVAGSGGNDLLYGRAGFDTLNGGTGDDSVFGGGVDDRLIGGFGNDYLRGADGADFLYGGDGADTLRGDQGNDTFYFTRASERDTVIDFAAGPGLADVIRLFAFGTATDTFAEVLARATDNGVDTTINFGAGEIVVLKGVLKNDLAADDFLFG